LDYPKYRDRRLRQDPKLARAYEQENLEREISREILRLRQLRGWSQVRLVEALHTKQSAVARLESGSHRPSLATLDRICEVLDARLEVRLTPCEADSG
jgi:ribosome-binding protein aMBF1 (putative translation factor)